MANISLENVFLGETVLTSTKNKFLIESHECDENNEFCYMHPSVKGLYNLVPRAMKKAKSLLSENSRDSKCRSTSIRRCPAAKKKKFKKYLKRSDKVYRAVPQESVYHRHETDQLDLMLCADSAPTEENSCLFGGIDWVDQAESLGAEISCEPSDLAFQCNMYHRGEMSSDNIRRAVPCDMLYERSTFAFGSGGPPNLKMATHLHQLHKPGGAYITPELYPEISEMPVYNFVSKDEFEIKSDKLSEFLDIDTQSLEMEQIRNLKIRKMQFLNAASMALICISNLKDVTDSFRIFFIKYADAVRAFDPEFILKVALYSRQELQIRSASNFLLSYAAYYEETRPYLKKYFETCIRLPSDWIEVAEFYQVFADERLKSRSLPSALKKVMMKSFLKFDAYQLAKYNKNKKKNSINKAVNTSMDEKSVTKISSQPVRYTLKQLIRLLHLSSPANEIMCLLGKKYPETPECFKICGLSGVWESDKAGKRMKLPVPETWETQISSYGNKAVIWERLIDNSKLPFMAMLRNLKNLILSGISQKHHEKVIKQLENKFAVMSSRQLPLQFYEAFKVLVGIEELLEKNNSDTAEDTSSSEKKALWEVKRASKISIKIKNSSKPLLERYKTAVSRAIEISALYNLQPIPGNSLIIWDGLLPDKLGVKKKNKVCDLCIMTGWMCLNACEYCKMSFICGSHSETIVLSEKNEFLQNIMKASSSVENVNQSMVADNSVVALKSVLNIYLKQQTILREQLDHVIFLRASGNKTSFEIKEVMSSFLHTYRQIVNPNLLYTDVDFLNNTFSFEDTDTSDGKDVYLCGNTTQLIKFIAERSTEGQLVYVDNIDTKYKLLNDIESDGLKKLTAEVSEKKISLPLRVPKWHTVRIFISSTFKDMHCERDLLIRYVMPELRRRAASVFVKINEVDLRWGITEADCTTKRAAELCLIEAQKSDLFIGMLGDRYGSMYDFEPPDSPDLQWVKDCPSDLSITELEMYAGALREDKLLKKRAFFYFRCNVFLCFVPGKWKTHFASENPESKKKLETLKSKILSSGLKVFKSYPCNWAGVLNNKPILSGLDVFGEDVLNDLWKAISDMYEKDTYLDDVAEEEVFQQEVLESFDCFVETKKSLLESLIKETKKESGIYLISGAPGSGKTAFIANLIQKLENTSVIKFFVGLTPRSTDVSYMLQYICNSIARQFPVSSLFPKMSKDVLNNFPDVLHEAARSSGNAGFVLVIDGLDHLETEDQMMDWLPFNLPPGLRLICSASDSSYAFRALIERKVHGSPMYVHNLSALEQSDRECIVRHYLQLYGKALDESPFNNQMLQLVTKKDSVLPLYLRISCDFLRNYASFENFMSKLQNLPSTMSLVLQEIILQMENDYGPFIVQTALTLLCITKEGLDDADLHLLLSLTSTNKGESSSITYKEGINQITQLVPDTFLSQITYCSLIHTICTFSYGHNRLRKLSSIGSEFEKAVKKFYLNKNYSHYEKSMHSLLAAYYFIQCDPKNDGSWKGLSGSAFRGLIYHLFHGKCYLELADNLCCLKFLEAIFSVEAADSVFEYYSLLLDDRKGKIRKLDFSLLSSYHDFLSRNQHIFQQYPYLVVQQALNEPPDSLVKLSLKCTDKRSFMVERLSHYNYDPRIATLSGFVKNITAVSYQEAKPLALLGSEDGYLKVLDLVSKKVIRSIKSHSSAITFICTAGKNRICTASTDTTLSIWSSVDYSRISVLRGHKHNVSCCCAEPSGNILLSSGWDNSVRLWSIRDGRSISVIDDFRCPVNCLDHHPMKQLIACGLWKGNIEIWDTISLKKMLVLPGKCSVKSIAYTSDGVNIISSYINSDVNIWSSEQGLKISNLNGHTLPVKTINYSFAGDMIISGSDDCTIKVWPTNSGLSVRTLEDCKFCPISMMEIISPDVLAISFQNSEICVMDLNNGMLISKMAIEADMVSCFSRSKVTSEFHFTADNLVDAVENWVDLSLVFGTQGGKVLVGNFSTSVITTVGFVKARVTSINHNKNIILCATSDGDIGLFSYPEIYSIIVSGAHQGSITALDLFANNGMLMALSAASDKVVKTWLIDYTQLKIAELGKFVSKHKDWITSCCFWECLDDLDAMDDTEMILTGSHDNNLILQDDESETFFRGLQTSVVSVGFSDTCILGCASDGSVALWSIDGTLLSHISGIEQSSVILSFYIDKDTTNNFDVTLAFVDKDGSVKIRKPLQRSYWYSLEGHSKSVTSCCANQNREILSCSLDGTVNFWKVPVNIQDSYIKHSGSVNDIILSFLYNLAVSSDDHGGVVLWKVLQTAETFSLAYGTKKTYNQGFVKALSWLNEGKFVAAISQKIDNLDKNFLDILSFDCSSDVAFFNLQVKLRHFVESEVLCLDSSSSSGTIVVGFKSGDIIIIATSVRRKFCPSKNWILGVKLVQSHDSVESILCSLLDGTVQCFETAEIIRSDDYLVEKISSETLHYPGFGDTSAYISSFYCDSENTALCGDANGWLRVYSKNATKVMKKVHNDVVTGISVVGCYLFTCSLDRTLKGWNRETLEQVCQYHSSVPITSLVGQEAVDCLSSPSHLLMIGTTSGSVQLLKFHHT